MALKTPNPFLIHDAAFKDILGPDPKMSCLLTYDSYPLAHEAGVFIPSTNELFITSNQFQDINGKTQIQISKVTLGQGQSSSEVIKTDCVPMANGGINYQDGILFCAQGTLDAAGGLAFMEARPPYRSRFLIQGFYGRPFNSVNDVVVHSDGSIWFTDPIYGFEQGIRPPPQLPSQVYRFDPPTGGLRAVADGFGRPNGICFSPDESVLYITDTDFIHGDGSTDLTRASSIYAFDVIRRSGQPFLTGRRLFAMADKGVPDGIKCDIHGNVYSGCGDGVNVWTPGGILLGRILVDGGVANFCFGRKGEMFLLNETRLWRVQLAGSTMGALLKI